MTSVLIMKKVMCIVGLAVLFSCESKPNYEKPKDLIPRDEMIDLLYDMHLAVGTSNLKNKNLEKDRNYMSLVYEKHNIDSTRFAISNIYYTSRVDEYEEMFEEVERRLEELHLIYESERDSIVKARERKILNKGNLESSSEIKN